MHFAPTLHHSLQRLAALALALTAIGFVAIFTWLASAFGYPDVLDQPATIVLPRLAAGGDTLRLVWVVYALLPLLLLPITAWLAPRLASPAARNLFRTTGSLAALTLLLGLIRWPSLHHLLAAQWPTADAATRAAIAVGFDASNRYLGTFLGEFVAELFLYAWIGLGAATLRGTRLAGLRYGAYLTAANGMLGAFRWLGGPPEWAGEVSNLLLPTWLLLWSLALALPLRSPRRTQASAPASARSSSPGPHGLLASAVLLLGLTGSSAAQSRFEGSDLSINGFRNPSIGLEYRRGAWSGHLGYYTTILPTGTAEADATNGFVRTGVTYWLLPFGQREGLPSSGYVSASWLVHTHEHPPFAQGAILEAGARFFIWRGLNARIGVAALVHSGKTYINPTPGISWTIPLR